VFVQLAVMRLLNDANVSVDSCAFRVTFICVFLSSALPEAFDTREQIDA